MMKLLKSWENLDPILAILSDFLQLSKEVRQAIKERRDFSRTCSPAGPLKEEEQLLWLEKICREDLSVRAVEKLLQQKKESQKET